MDLEAGVNSWESKSLPARSLEQMKTRAKLSQKEQEDEQESEPEEDVVFMRRNVFDDNTAEIVPSRKFVSKVFKALYSKFNQIYTSNLGYQVLIILYGSA